MWFAGWDKGAVPNGMLRFMLLVNITSSAFPSHNTAITIKASSWSQLAWTSFMHRPWTMACIICPAFKMQVLPEC